MLQKLKGADDEAELGLKPSFCDSRACALGPLGIDCLCLLAVTQHLPLRRPLPALHCEPELYLVGGISSGEREE